MIARLKLWWQIKTGQVDVPWEKDAQFWLVSLTVHLVLLIVLAKCFIRNEWPSRVNLSAPQDPLADLVELPPAIDFDEMKFEEVGDVGENNAPMVEATTNVTDIVRDAPVEISVPEIAVTGLQFDKEFLDANAENIKPVQTKGNVGVSTTGAAGAVDRITQEILLSLDNNKTMVVWLFDQSASLISQREEIRGRFDKIYRELHNLASEGREEFAKHGDQPLLSVVYAYGSTFTRMTKDPTDDTDSLLAAIDKISRDETGLEYVFSAVIQAATDFKKMRKINKLTDERERNVMIIVVSDEAGDDLGRLDEAANYCMNLQIPVYVVGVPAPFGREETLVRWVDPDPAYDQSPQWALVSQGPESVMSELVKLDYNNGDFEDLQMIDSGFGPFGLTRLAYETGGIYFAVHPNRQVGAAVSKGETANYSAFLKYFFDSEVMRKYKPDYVSQATYMQRLTGNKARMALVQAAQISRVGTFESPIQRFPKFEEAQFVNLVSTAQRGAAILEPKLAQLYEVLRIGEADRDEELSPRWQAGYDLAFGRVLANKIRTETYNGMLALIKTKLKFENPKNNTWVLQPAESIETGSQAAAIADKARMYLNRVINEHPDTPWAMLAKRELETPLGWQWKETFTEPPRPPQQMQPGNNNNAVQFNPQPRPNEMPKPKRLPPKL